MEQAPLVFGTTVLTYDVLQEIYRAIWLGVVQGIAEFLPISSSGHLILFEALLADSESPRHNLGLNVALHVGTLFSILVVYRRDVRAVLQNPRLCGLIVLATIPVFIVGLVFQDRFEQAFQTPVVAAIGWFLTAALLLLVEKTGHRTDGRPLEEIDAKQALIIGLFQAIAPVPGVSRAGTTIAGGLFCGLHREAAAGFSFLLAIPVIAGAAFLTLAKGGIIVRSDHLLPLVVGMVTSFLVGLVALRLLLRVLSRGWLHWFAYYCIAIAVATLVCDSLGVWDKGL